MRERAVRAHVVDDLAGSDHDAIAALLDALDVSRERMVVDDLACLLDLVRLPDTAQVRRTLRERLPAAGEDRRRHLAVPATVRRVSDGDLVCAHVCSLPRE